MSTSLAGKRIIVTGSSHGIGRAIALRLGAEGARVVVNGSGQGSGGRARAQADLEQLVRLVEVAGGEALPFVGSVAEEAAAKALVETAVAGFGGLDGLVQCAGIAGAPANSIREISLEDWRAVLAVHLDGSFFCSRAAIPHLIRAGGGSIVHTSSHGALGGFGGSAYPAAKGAINSLTFAMAADLAADGIRVNAVCPGARTRLSSGPDYERVIGRLEERGLLTPEAAAASLDVPPPEGCAPIYAYLLDDASRAVSGRIFTASGNYVGVLARSEEQPIASRAPDAPHWSIEELHTLVSGRLAELVPRTEQA